MSETEGLALRIAIADSASESRHRGRAETLEPVHLRPRTINTFRQIRRPTRRSGFSFPMRTLSGMATLTTATAPNSCASAYFSSGESKVITRTPMASEIMIAECLAEPAFIENFLSTRNRSSGNSCSAERP